MIRSRRLLAIFAVVAAAACSKPQPPDVSPNASSAPAASQAGQCSMDIRPGVSLGPILVGETRADLGKHGLPVKVTSTFGLTEFVEVGSLPLNVKLCGGRVAEVWMDDLRAAPSCVSLTGRAVDRALPREKVVALFSGCKDAPQRRGGEFVECEDGGVRIGWGMGDFVQVRVGKRGTRLDDTCEALADSGRPTSP